MTKGMGKKPKWTTEEDDILREGYRNGELSVEIAARLGRNKNQVLGRAFRLGIKSPLNISEANKRRLELMPKEPFSFYEDVLNWGKTNPFGTARECSLQLGIRYNTVAKHVSIIKRGK